MIKLNFIFRKPSPSFHSIEEQFFAMQKELPEDLRYRNSFAKFYSRGLFRRLFIAIQAAFNQGNINHITGDIHFVAAFLKKKRTILTVHDIGSAVKREAGRREAGVRSRKTEAGRPKPGVGRPESEGRRREAEAGRIAKPGLKARVLRYFWFVMPFNRVKYVTVISEFTKQEILQEFSIKPEKIIVIPDCVSPQIEFSEYTFNTVKPNILQVGTKSNKNLERVINAIQDIDCKLHILGKISETQIALLKEHTINYINHFNLDYPEVIDLYKQSDLLIFASTYEGFGVPVLEAQATGRPVITSNISPMKDVAGEGALLVDPYNTEDIRNAVLSLINEPDSDKASSKKALKM
jgi:glycosyltransferase involved in cell wall biosynthesis